MSSLVRVIEVPLRAVSWFLGFLFTYMIPICVIAGCIYLIYRIYKWRFKKPIKEIKKQNYWDNYVQGGTKQNGRSTQ